jgi:hypothetical protein
MNTLLSSDGEPNGLSINLPAIRNASIVRCCKAWIRTYDTEIAGGRGMISSGCRANEAFRTAMPPLTTPANVRNFIACTTYGLMTGAICDTAGQQLLDAARVAISLLREENASKRQENGAKMAQKGAKKQPINGPK